MRKKFSAAERLMRRPGPKKSGVSKAIRQSSQSLNPQIGGELNLELRDSASPRRGAPKGNRNAWKHGCYGRERQLWLLQVRILSRQTRWLEQHFRELSRAARAARLTV